MKFNRLAISLAALALLAVLAAKVLSWLANPYGLEPERLGPRGNEHFEEAKLVAGSYNWLLLPQYEQNDYAVHVPIPAEYVSSSNPSLRWMKGYLTAAFMFYPSMRGGFHPENAALMKVRRSYGDGYISVDLDARKDSARVRDGRHLDFLNRFEDGVHYQRQTLPKTYGFDDHFLMRSPIDERGSNAPTRSAKEYFIKRHESGETKYLFDCSPFMPWPNCKTHFNLPSRPEVVVEIVFGYELMTEWESVVDSVDRKIASWRPVRVAALRAQ